MNNHKNGNGNGNGFLPMWVQSGLMFVLVIILISICVGGLSISFMTEPIGFFTCSALPSVIFKYFFYGCCPWLTRNIYANVIFFLLFWFAIGALVGRLFRWIRGKTY